MPMRVGIVGLGLIGTSIGLGLRKWASVYEIYGHDGLPEHESIAAQTGAVDVCIPLEKIAQCDLVFVAVPPDAVIATLSFIEKFRGEATIVSDCAGVKSEIARWARPRGRRHWLVPGHPMGGTEHSGPAHGDPDMFAGKAWILTPPRNGGQTAYYTVEAAVKALGAIPIRVEAGDHDAQIALVSHLPHILAAALLIQADRPAVRVPSGGSWRDATRVGGSNPELWTQLTASNRKEVIRALNGLIKELTGVRSALYRRNLPWMRTFFARAAEAKRKGAGN